MGAKVSILGRPNQHTRFHSPEETSSNRSRNNAKPNAGMKSIMFSNRFEALSAEDTGAEINKGDIMNAENSHTETRVDETEENEAVSIPAGEPEGGQLHILHTDENSPAATAVGTSDIPATQTAELSGEDNNREQPLSGEQGLDSSTGEQQLCKAGEPSDESKSAKDQIVSDSSCGSSFVQELNSRSIVQSVTMIRDHLIDSQSPEPGEPRDEEIELIKAFKGKSHIQVAAEAAVRKAMAKEQQSSSLLQSRAVEPDTTVETHELQVVQGQQEKNIELDKGIQLRSVDQNNKSQKGIISKGKKAENQSKVS